jgi:glycosyltransferase involved in cell wall biosynthesis
MEEKVIILIPTYNNSKTIGEVVKKCLDIGNGKFKVIVIDDGSTDDSGEIAKNAGALVLSHKKNIGKGAAIKTGFEYIKKLYLENYKSLNSKIFIATLDADSQHNPEDIPRLLNLARRKNALVIGSRDILIKNDIKTLLRNPEMPIFRYIGNKLISRIISFLIQEKIADSQSGFRVFPLHLLENNTLREKRYGIETELIFRAKKLNLPIIETPIKTIYPTNTKFSSFNLLQRIMDKLSRAWDIFRVLVLETFSLYKSKNIVQALIILIVFIVLVFQIRTNMDNILNDSNIDKKIEKFKDENINEKTLSDFIWLKQNTPKDAIILTPSYEAHRIMAFSDRKVIVSGKVYPSESMESYIRQRDVSRFFFTTDLEEAKKIAEKYQAKYIFIEKKPKFLSFCNIGDACHFVTYSPEGLTPDGKKKTLIGRLIQGEKISEFPLIKVLSKHFVYEINLDASPVERPEFELSELKNRIKIAKSKITPNIAAPIKEKNEKVLKEKNIWDKSFNYDSIRTFLELTEYAKNSHDEQVFELARKIANDLKIKFLENRILSGHYPQDLELNYAILLATGFKNMYEIENKEEYTEFAFNLGKWIIENQHPIMAPDIGGAFPRTNKSQDASPIITARAAKILLELYNLSKEIGSSEEEFKEAAIDALYWLIKQKPGSEELENEIYNAGILYLNLKQ